MADMMLRANARRAAAPCLSAGWALGHAQSARPRRVDRAEPCDRGLNKEGFTLIELLVALAVFSLAALALLNLSGENTRSAARVETRTLGGIVAENLAVETMIAPTISEGTTSGQTPLAGRPWVWTRTVTTTDEPDLLRIDIKVRDAEGQAAERTLFRSRTRQ
ncbi:type II secretion system minor pseudopilin GspI [Brevundimonas sp. UBA2416]|uniref:type II secretion system minor pseudopilin GspI n=1 Tax=Brevundimonas sp. UBA2416 TaxID=1946124 RepID=UPI0032E48E19